MRPRLPRLPHILNGWPRRAAAALCFALALLTSFAPAKPRAAQVDTSVPPGLVATSASVFADAVTFVHPGDHIDLVETSAGSSAESRPPPTVVAHDVRVLDVRAANDLGAQPRTAQLLVAAPREVAVAIAAHQGDRVLAAISAPP